MVEGLTYIEDLPFMVVVQFLSLFSFLRWHGFATVVAGWSSGSSSGS